MDLNPYSGGNRFRDQRFSWFIDLLSRVRVESRPVRILDVGGLAEYWAPRLKSLNADVRVTLLNLSAPKVEDPRFESLSGDARDLSQFADNSFDVVHSNSVLEHVGRWPDMQRMASEVARVAPAHFVQTPNYWFPIEPHCRQPLFHWLPRPLRRRLVMKRALGFWPQSADIDIAMRRLDSALLLDRSEFQFLFPTSEIRNERFLGLTKSFVAIREWRKEPSSFLPVADTITV